VKGALRGIHQVLHQADKQSQNHGAGSFYELW
jgi:hypothetical protein